MKPDWTKAPEGATHCGSHLFYKVTEDSVLFWLHGMGWTYSDAYVLGEITMDDLIPRPATPEWNGDGYPPVGCECEARCDTFKEEWYRAYIIGTDGKNIIGRWREGPLNGLLIDYVVNGSFRPLRTAEQRQRDEVITNALRCVPMATNDEIHPRQYLIDSLHQLYAAGMLRKGDE